MHTMMRWGLRAGVAAAATVGVAAVAIGAMIATPVKVPPELPSISTSARAIDRSNLPPVQRFQARDGTELGYRAYLPAEGAPRRIAILIHGSSGNGTVLNVMARALAADGVIAIAPDMRGHGVSGTRGDISYMGQLDDDLEDLVAELRSKHGALPVALAGHSSGGGFALRIAAGSRAALFDRFILLAPFLGPNAITSKPQVGQARWAEPDIPRIVGLIALRRIGIACCEHLPVLAFAAAPNAEKFQTTKYSFRLMANFAVDALSAPPFAKVGKPIAIISGDKDELIESSRFEELVRSNGGRAAVVVVPGVDHMRLLDNATAIEAMKEDLRR